MTKMKKLREKDGIKSKFRVIQPRVHHLMKILILNDSYIIWPNADKLFTENINHRYFNWEMGDYKQSIRA